MLRSDFNAEKIRLLNGVMKVTVSEADKLAIFVDLSIVFGNAGDRYGFRTHTLAATKSRRGPEATRLATGVNRLGAVGSGGQPGGLI